LDIFKHPAPWPPAEFDRQRKNPDVRFFIESFHFFVVDKRINLLVRGFEDQTVGRPELLSHFPFHQIRRQTGQLDNFINDFFLSQRRE